MFLFLNKLSATFQDSIVLIQHGIDTLRRKTSYSTFYELFNLSEAASMKSIKKKFHQALKQEYPIPTLSKQDGENLLTDGYNILTKYKETYDYYLKFHYYPKETTSYLWLKAMLILCFVGFVDICFMIFKNKRQEKMTKKEVKKAMRKGKHLNGIKFGELYSVRVIMWVKRKIVG